MQTLTNFLYPDRTPSTSEILADLTAVCGIALGLLAAFLYSMDALYL